MFSFFGKSKKFKFVSILVLVILIAIGIVSYIIINNYIQKKELENKMEIYIASLQNEDYDSTIEICNSLNEKELEKVRDELIKAFVEVVKNNKYTYVMELPPSYVSSTQVFEYIPQALDYDAIYKYEKYKRVSDIIKISEDDGTNVVEYIDAVLALKENSIYDEYLECIKIVMGKYVMAAEYFSDGTNSYSTDVRLEKYNSALQIVNECNEIVDNYDNSSGIFDDVKTAFDSFKVVLEKMISGDGISYEEFEMLKNSYGRAGVGIGSVYDTVNNAVEALPEVY